MTAQVQAPPPAAVPPPPPPSSSGTSSPRTHRRRGTTAGAGAGGGGGKGSPRSARRRRASSAQYDLGGSGLGSGGGSVGSVGSVGEHAKSTTATNGSDPSNPHPHHHHQQQHQYDDDGTPSTSISTDLYRALALIHDERHLVAYDLYRDARGRVEEMEGLFKNGVDGGGGNASNGAASAATNAAAFASPRQPRNRMPFSPVLRRRTPGTTPGAATGTATAGGGASNATHTEEENERRADWERAGALLERNEEEFNRLEKRANLFLRAKQNLTIDDDWVKAQTLFGITTYYRREPDDSLSIKLEGHLSGIPLFEQLAVLREVDLYHSWAPFCVASTKLAQLGKIDVVSWFLTGLPKFGLSRDACFRAVGCDSMREDGSIILVGEGLGDRMEDGVNVKPYLEERTEGEIRASAAASAEASTVASTTGGSTSPTSTAAKRQRMQKVLSGSVHDSSNMGNWAKLDDEYEFGSYLSRDSVLDTIQLPPVPDKFGSGRMTIRSFQGVIDVLSPSSARTRIVTNIDPNLRFVPQSLIDYCMKKMCGILLSRLQGTARGVLKDPVHSLHARRMREDAQFYRLWLLPKFRAYCEDLGWDLPPVAAFNVSEEDLGEEEWLLYSQLNEEVPDVRRTLSDGDVGIAAAAGGGGRAAASLDAPPTSRRLFQTERQGRDRSVVSESALRRQGEPMRRFGDGRTRTKLRQLLPSESMEISLTSPDLLQRWEQRQAKKKALAVASARRKAALRLRPAPPNEEQAKRLAQLKEAKVRFLAGKRGGSQSSTSGRSHVARRGVVAEDTSSSGPSTSTLLQLVSFTHPSIPHKIALPIMLVVMFVIYHADNGVLYRLIEPRTDEDPGSIIQNGFRIIAREATFGIVLAVYGMVHWAVLNLALVVAFDFVELPLLSLAGTSRELQNAKALYSSSTRTITTYITLAIIVLASGSSLFSYFWSFIVRALFPIEGPGLIETLASTFYAALGRIGANFPIDIHPTETLAAFASPVMKFAGVVGAPIRHSIGLIANSLLGLWHLATLGWFVDFGMGAKEWISSGVMALSNAIFSVDDGSLAWRSETLDKSKMLMSYNAAFVISLVAIAHIIFPKGHPKTRSQSSSDGGTEEPMLNRTGTASGVDNAAMTMTSMSGGVSSFSLASGELLENTSVQSASPTYAVIPSVRSI